jgi:hypothetical protein
VSNRASTKLADQRTGPGGVLQHVEWCLCTCGDVAEFRRLLVTEAAHSSACNQIPALSVVYLGERNPTGLISDLQ